MCISRLIELAISKQTYDLDIKFWYYLNIQLNIDIEVNF